MVGLLLAWVWRFWPTLWHRNSALFLLALVLLATGLLLRVTADRSVLPYLAPTAAAALLLAVLLDNGVALVMTALLGVLAASITGVVEMGAYTVLGGIAGLIVVRRGERLGQFIQAALAISVVNVTVVVTFTLLGTRDVTALLQLIGASLFAGVVGAIVAAGTFALLGNVFGITTSFQLLELANPSQPLLRRLLLETPGTYHHSLMVGNLAERAAGGDRRRPAAGSGGCTTTTWASWPTRSRSSRTRAARRTSTTSWSPSSRRRSSQPTWRTGSTSPTATSCPSR